MPQHKRLGLRICLAIASVAACLVCDVGFLNHRDARGPKYLKLVLSPREYRNAIGLPSTADRVVFPRRGAWYPGKHGAAKVVSLSGEADELLDIISEIYGEKRSFKFLVQRSSVGALIGPGGDSVKELRRQLNDEHNETQVVIDDVNVASPAEVEVILLTKNTTAVHEVARWIMDNQDVQDELSRNLACGYEDRVSGMRSEIFVRLSAKERGHLIGKGGGGVCQLREEYFVGLNVDNKESTIQISGLAGDVSAFHRHLLQMQKKLALEEQKREKERERQALY